MARGKRCDGPSHQLTAQPGVEGCARACAGYRVGFRRCQFFRVGTGLEKGNCFMDLSSCTDTRSASFDLYKYHESGTGRDYVAKAFNARCEGGSELLSDRNSTVEACAEQCRQRLGCQYFAQGYGNNRGMCYFEHGNCSATRDALYDVYELPDAAPNPFKLERRGRVCRGPDERMGHGLLTSRECAGECMARMGCRYFAVTGPGERGKCYFQKSDCSELLPREAQLYSVKTDVQMLRPRAECNGTDALIGTELSPRECRRACERRAGCERFLVGVGTGRGKCYWEKNTCSSFVPSARTDVYKVSPKGFEVALIRGKAECVGPHKLLASQVGRNECKELCLQKERCEFFIHSPAGKCYWEDSNCTKFKPAEYSVYQIRAIDPAAKRFKKISNSAECVGARSSLGVGLDTVGLCGDACKQALGCQHFSVGRGPKSGQCMQEDSSCTETRPADFDVYTMPEFEPPPARTHTMLRHGQKCAGTYQLLAEEQSTAECAQECKVTEGCEFFLIGTGVNKGRCVWSQGTCQGFITDEYNSFRMSSVLTQVAARSECVGARERLAEDTTVASCGTKCEALMNCEFFSVGTGDREGMCYKEADCTSLVSNNNYNVYSYRKVDIVPQDYSIYKRQMQCTGEMENLAQPAEIEQCAEECRKRADCEFFLVGNGPNQGRCYMQKECADFEEAAYDIYKLDLTTTAPTPAPALLQWQGNPLPTIASLDNATLTQSQGKDWPGPQGEDHKYNKTLLEKVGVDYGTAVSTQDVNTGSNNTVEFPQTTCAFMLAMRLWTDSSRAKPVPVTDWLDKKADAHYLSTTDELAVFTRTFQAGTTTTLDNEPAMYIFQPCVERDSAESQYSSVSHTIQAQAYASDTTIFEFTGTDQTYRVPAGAYKLEVKLWGAGGAGSAAAVPKAGQAGTGGAFVSGILRVQPAMQLAVVVGQGGRPGGCKAAGADSDSAVSRVVSLFGKGAGGHGGRSAILFEDEDLASAGGGSGAKCPMADVTGSSDAQGLEPGTSSTVQATGSHAAAGDNKDYPLISPLSKAIKFRRSESDRCTMGLLALGSVEDCQRAGLQLNYTVEEYTPTEPGPLGCIEAGGRLYYVSAAENASDYATTLGESTDRELADFFPDDKKRDEDKDFPSETSEISADLANNSDTTTPWAANRTIAICAEAASETESVPVAIGGSPAHRGGNGYVTITAFIRPSRNEYDSTIDGVLDKTLEPIRPERCASSQALEGSCDDAIDPDMRTAMISDQATETWIATDLGSLHQVTELQLWRPSELTPSQDTQPEGDTLPSTLPSYVGEFVVESGTGLGADAVWSPSAQFTAAPDAEQVSLTTNETEVDARQAVQSDKYESFTVGLNTVTRYIRIRVKSTFAPGATALAINSVRWIGAKIVKSQGWVLFMKQYHKPGWEKLGNPHNGFFGVANWFGRNSGDLSGNMLLGASLKQEILKAPKVKLVVRQRSSGKRSSITWPTEKVLSFLNPGGQLQPESDPVWSRSEAVVDDAGRNTKAQIGVCKAAGGFASIFAADSGLRFLDATTGVPTKSTPDPGCSVGNWGSQMLFRPQGSGSYSFGVGRAGDFGTADYDFEMWYQARIEASWTLPVACTDSGTAGSESGTCMSLLASNDVPQGIALRGVEGAWITFDLGKLQQVSKLQIHQLGDSRKMKQFILERADAAEATSWTSIAELQASEPNEDEFEMFTGFQTIAQFLRIRVLSNYGNEREVVIGTVQFDAIHIPEKDGFVQFLRQHHGGGSIGDLHSGAFGVLDWYRQDLGDLRGNFLVAKSQHKELLSATTIKLKVIRRSSGQAEEILFPNSATVQHLFDGVTNIEGGRTSWGSEVGIATKPGGTDQIVKFSMCKSPSRYFSIAMSEPQVTFLAKKSTEPNVAPNSNCSFGAFDAQLLFQPQASGSYNFGDANTGDFNSSDFNFEMWYEPRKEQGNWTRPLACSDNSKRGGQCKAAFDGDRRTSFVSTVKHNGWLAFDLGSIMQTTKLRFHKPGMLSPERRMEGVKEFVLEQGDSLALTANWSSVGQFKSAHDSDTEEFGGFTAVGRYLRIRFVSNHGGEMVRMWEIELLSEAVPVQDGWLRFMRQSQHVGWSKLGDGNTGLLSVPDWFDRDYGRLDGSYLFAHSLKTQVQEATHIRMNVIERGSGKVATVTWQNKEAIQAFMGQAAEVGAQGKPWGVDKAVVSGDGPAVQAQLTTCRTAGGDRSIFSRDIKLAFLGKTAEAVSAEPNITCSTGKIQSEMLFQPGRPGSYNFGEGAVGGFADSIYDFEFWIKSPVLTAKWLSRFHGCADSGAEQGSCKQAYDRDLETSWVAAPASTTWLSFDLGDFYKVTKLEIWRAIGDGLDDAQLKLQRGDAVAGESWQDVAVLDSKRRNSPGFATFDSFVMVGRYMRLVLPASTALHEVSVYADALPKDSDGFITFLRQGQNAESQLGNEHSGFFGVLNWLGSDLGTPDGADFLYGRSLREAILGAGHIKMTATRHLTRQTASMVWTNELPHGGPIRGFINPANASLLPPGMVAVNGSQQRTIYGMQAASVAESQHETGLCVSQDKFRSMWFSGGHVEWLGRLASLPSREYPNASCSVGAWNSQILARPDMATGSYGFGDGNTGDLAHSGYDFEFSFKPTECDISGDEMPQFEPVMYLDKYSDVLAECGSKNATDCAANHWEQVGRSQMRIGCTSCCPGRAVTKTSPPTPPPPPPPTASPTVDPMTVVVAPAYAAWDFEELKSNGELIGELSGDAMLSNGKLVLTGGSFKTQVIPETVQAKTLVVLARLSDVEQCCGGALALQNENHWDGIIWAGQQQTWETGSEGGVRSRHLSGTQETEPEWVHVAAVYSLDNKVTVYRNGQPYEPFVKGMMQVFEKDSAWIQIGINPGMPQDRLTGQKNFIGEIESAAFYDRALTAHEVLALYVQTKPASSCQGGVTLYANDIPTRSDGWAYMFSEGAYSSDEYVERGGKLDAVASLRVPKGCEAVLYGQDLEGWSARFAPGDYSSEAMAGHGAVVNGTRSLRVVEYGPAQALVATKLRERHARLQKLQSQVDELAESMAIARDKARDAHAEFETTKKAHAKHRYLEAQARSEARSKAIRVEFQEQRLISNEGLVSRLEKKLTPSEHAMISAEAALEAQEKRLSTVTVQEAVAATSAKTAQTNAERSTIVVAKTQRLLTTKQDANTNALTAGSKAEAAAKAAQKSAGGAEEVVEKAHSLAANGDSTWNAATLATRNVAAMAANGRKIEVEAEVELSKLQTQQKAEKAALDQSQKSLIEGQREVQVWRKKMRAMEKTHREDKSSWRKAVNDAKREVMSLKRKERAREETLNEDRQKTSDAKLALRKETGELTEFENDNAGLMKQHREAVAAVHKAVAEFEALKQARPMASLEVQSAANAVKRAKAEADSMRERLQQAQDDASQANESEDRKVGEAENSLETGAAQIKATEGDIVTSATEQSNEKAALGQASRTAQEAQKKLQGDRGEMVQAQSLESRTQKAETAAQKQQRKKEELLRLAKANHAASKSALARATNRQQKADSRLKATEFKLKQDQKKLDSMRLEKVHAVASLKAAEAAVNTAGSQYREAVQDEETTSEQLVEAMEQRKQSSSKLNSLEKRQAGTESIVHDQEQVARRAKNMVESSQDRSTDAATKRNAARESKAASDLAVLKAREALSEATKRHQLASKALVKAKGAVERSKVDVLRAKDAQRTAVVEAEALQSHMQQAQALLSAARSERTLEHRKLIALEGQMLALKSSLEYTEEGKASKEQQLETVLSDERRIGEAVKGLKAEQQSELEQLASKRMSLARDRQQMVEKAKEQQDAEGMAQAASSNMKQLQKTRLTSKQKLEELQSEERTASERLNKRKEDAHLAKETATRAAAQASNATGELLSSTSLEEAAQRAFKHWSTARTNHKLDRARETAAAIKSAADVQAGIIKNETDRMAMALREHAKEKETLSKQQYDRTMKHVQGEMRDEDNFVAAARTKAMNEQRDATQSEIIRMARTRRELKLARYRLKSHLEQDRAAATRAAAGSLKLAGSQALHIHHLAKQKATLDIQNGVALASSAKQKECDAKSAAKELDKINSELEHQRYKIMKKADKKVARLEDVATKVADKRTLKRSRKNRKRQRKLVMRAKINNKKVEAAARKHAQMYVTEQAQHQKAADKLDAAAAEAEINVRRQAHNATTAAQTQAESIDLHSSNELAKIKRLADAEMDKQSQENLRAENQAKEQVSAQETKTKKSIAEAKAKCKGEDCVVLLQLDADTLSVLDDAETVNKDNTTDPTALPSAGSIEGQVAPGKHGQDIATEASKRVVHFTSLHNILRGEYKRAAHKAIKSLEAAIELHGNGSASLENADPSSAYSASAEIKMRAAVTDAADRLHHVAAKASASKIKAMNRDLHLSASAEAVRYAQDQQSELDAWRRKLADNLESGSLKIRAANMSRMELEQRAQEVDAAILAEKATDAKKTRQTEEIERQLGAAAGKLQTESHKVSQLHARVGLVRSRVKTAEMKQADAQDKVKQNRLEQKKVNALAQQAQKKTRKALIATDRLAKKYRSNERAKHVAAQVAANAQAGLAVAQTVEATAARAESQTATAVYQAAKAEEEAIDKDSRAKVNLREAEGKVKGRERAAKPVIEAWEGKKQLLQQGEANLKTDEAAVVTQERKVQDQTAQVSTDQKSHTVAVEQVQSAEQVEVGAESTMDSASDALSTANMKEASMSTDVETVKASESKQEGLLNTAKTVTHKRQQEDQAASEKQENAGRVFEQATHSVDGLKDELLQRKEERGRLEQKVEAQKETVVEATENEDKAKKRFDVTVANTQELQARLAAEKQGEDVLKQVLGQVRTNAKATKALYQQRVKNAEEVSETVEADATKAEQRETAAETNLENMPEPIGSPQEKATMETAAALEEVETAQQSGLKQRAALQAVVQQAASSYDGTKAVEMEALQNFKDASNAVRRATIRLGGFEAKAQAAEKVRKAEVGRLHVKLRLVASNEHKIEAVVKEKRQKLQETRDTVRQAAKLVNRIHQVGAKLSLQSHKYAVALSGARRDFDSTLAKGGKEAEAARAAFERAKEHAKQAESAGSETSKELQAAIRTSRDAQEGAVQSAARLERKNAEYLRLKGKLQDVSSKLDEDEKNAKFAVESLRNAKADVARAEQQTVDIKAEIKLGQAQVATAKKEESEQSNDAKKKEAQMPALMAQVTNARAAYRGLAKDVTAGTLAVTRFSRGETDLNSSQLKTVLSARCYRADGTVRDLVGCA